MFEPEVVWSPSAAVKFEPGSGDALNDDADASCAAAPANRATTRASVSAQRLRTPPGVLEMTSMPAFRGDWRCFV